MRSILAFFVLVSAAGLAAAQPGPTGLWLNEPGTAHIEISPCGSALCGAIVWLKDPLDEAGAPKRDGKNAEEAHRTRPLLGLPMLNGFVPASDGGWENGTIYNPEDGKTYKCVMSLEDANKLRVRGYVGVPLFGKTQTWSRVR